MNFKAEIEKWLGEQAVIEVPTNLAHGDYSTNLALTSGKKAGDLVAELEQTKPEFIEKITVAGPGFINFFLKPEFVLGEVKRLVVGPTSSALGGLRGANNIKVLFEYTDPNPFKEFHIGHLMSNAIGETLARLTETTGAEVKRACYQGDVGLHVAKALWGKQKGEVTWGEAYVAGSKAYEESETAKQEIVALNKKVYEKSDPALNELYEQGKKETLAEFEKIYAKLGTKFDFYFFESEMAIPGVKIVEEFLVKGLFEKSDGAVVFRGEKFNSQLHTRVYVTAQGLPTYEAKELGLHFTKAKVYPFDASVVITANEQDGVFLVGLEALRQIDPELAAKTKHLSHGMLRLPTGKMSSRTGKVITAEALIEEAKSKLTEKTTDPEIQEQVAIAAIKYSILRQAPGRDIIFDFDKSLSFEGDSGPYLQYTRARAHSVLEKFTDAARVTLPQGSTLKTQDSRSHLSVELKLIHFPEVVARAAQEFAPQHLVTYLTELASAFNAFYAQNQIVGSEEEDYRLTLTRAVEKVLTTGLNLLAIPVLDRM
ncbi:MAG: arginine--tRNA ligase [Patescibacteria group bacterium]